ncbi:MAG: paraquat-inducible protein A [Bacteroidota bacterium]
MIHKDPGRKILRILISTGILFVTVLLTVHMIVQARQNQEIKTDLAEVNHIRYGLLNVDEWSFRVSAILSEKILDFKLTPENRDQLQENLESILHMLVDEVELMIIERTSGQFSGVKRWIAGFTVDVSQLRDSVPSFANQVLEELDKPETKELLQEYLYEKLDEFSTYTYSIDSTVSMEALMQKYECSSKTECRNKLGAAIEEKNAAINLRVILILILVLLGFLVNTVRNGPLNPFQSTLLILFSFCLLLGGITTPMIDLEARIDQLMFQLVGKEVLFSNNIIFFQSKSITDVVRLLLEEGTFQMIFVGFLIFLFSIIFPSAKLISSLLYSFNLEKVTKNKLVRFFVFKSGKWSMADVMVVALFMAYVGFDGIIGSQLDYLSESSKPVEIFTTNGTRLLGGFYLFLCFCLSSLVLSELFYKNKST